MRASPIIIISVLLLNSPMRALYHDDYQSLGSENECFKYKRKLSNTEVTLKHHSRY